ncbi:hypothetical protein L6654_43030 [Bradyrhizobium sp. WYCCWR 13023]|uniref:Uncharacterized protein n=1 Tax=Bradyrhizobium zhengyangense TaxID=2911009 RepID=A0A9X1RLE3_9BRAD|nr:hypothetical protein [Bradyrhizobium zhengyangense]MCG2633278.1 hypothetical protein [Bradyrhizobium zhengyangense]
MRRWFPLIKFVGDISISTAIVAAGLVGAWRFVSTLGEFFAVLLLFGNPIGLVLVAAPFVIVLIPLPAFGLARARYGLVLGPILSLVITYGFHSREIKQEDDVLEQKRAAFAKLASGTAEPVGVDHTLLAVDGDVSSCDEACIKVLATSNHTLATRSSRDRDRTWTLYAQAEGPACLAKENAKLTLEFLLRGFPDKCATQTSIPGFEDGLLLRAIRSNNPGYRLTPDAPEGFTGGIYESFERIDGRDHLLARYIDGSFESKLDRFPLWKRPPAIKVGAPIDRMSFLARAIGKDVSYLRQPNAPFPFDEVFAGIEKFFDQKEKIDANTFRYARWAWLQIAANASRPQTRLLKERMLRLFASHDPFQIELAIEAISFMRLDERTFPDDVMLDLVFAPINREATVSLLEKQLDRQFPPGRPPPTDEVRERAKAHLNDPNLKTWQSHILTQISLLQ